MPLAWIAQIRQQRQIAQQIEIYEFLASYIPFDLKHWKLSMALVSAKLLAPFPSEEFFHFLKDACPWCWREANTIPGNRKPAPKKKAEPKTGKWQNT